MAYCKTAVTPLLTQWGYCSIAPSHRFVLVINLSCVLHMFKLNHRNSQHYTDCWVIIYNNTSVIIWTQWWYFFIIFEYILHISTPHIMIFCFPLPYFPLSTSALFLLSTLVLTLYIDVVLSLSISNGHSLVSHDCYYVISTTTKSPPLMYLWITTYMHLIYELHILFTTY